MDGFLPVNVGAGCKYGLVSGKFGTAGALEPIELELHPSLVVKSKPDDVEWFHTGVSLSGTFDQVFAQGGQACGSAKVIIEGDDESTNFVAISPLDGVEYYVADVAERNRGRQAYFAAEDYGDSVEINFDDTGASMVFVEKDDFDNVQVRYKGKLYDYDDVKKRLNKTVKPSLGITVWLWPIGQRMKIR